MYMLTIYAREIGALGVATKSFRFGGTDYDDAWKKWEEYNRSTGYRWEAVSRPSQYTR